MTQQDIIASLPNHLRPFVKLQDYSHYSPRDHAVWRFMLKHLTTLLSEHAHPVYLEGLERTGIARDHIPSIDEMNHCLARLGWRAVVVDGFIPPAIFMEFQAMKILVIALDMRSVEHIFYTPAPDIVHESAGHAPFIVDVDYAEFLQRFGEVGMKAISTAQDMKVYEAIRKLSILKECPDTSAVAIEQAERDLHDISAANTDLSEASLLTRLHWWTVEYGLVGEPDDYKIFGAGLLSSLGESMHCLDDTTVKKLPLTVEAVNCPYDITTQQPQLFVTKSCRHLSQVLEEFAATMCFNRGGAHSLQVAVDAGSICTAQYDSGMQVSAVMAEVLRDAVGNVTYLRTNGPTQLAFKDTEVYGHGTEYHDQGFGSPVGKLKDFSRCLSKYSVDELKAHKIVIGEPVVLEFLSGVTVKGRLRDIFRQEHRNLILSFDECTVTDLHGRVLFDPAWGVYDMAVGARIVSVYGGTADREKFQLYKSTPATTEQVEQDQQLMALYQDIDQLAREQSATTPQRLEKLLEGLHAYPDEWLLRVELQSLQAVPGLEAQMNDELHAIAQRNPELAQVIAMALGRGS